MYFCNSLVYDSTFLQVDFKGNHYWKKGFYLKFASWGKLFISVDTLKDLSLSRMKFHPEPRHPKDQGQWTSYTFPSAGTSGSVTFSSVLVQF